MGFVYCSIGGVMDVCGVNGRYSMVIGGGLPTQATSTKHRNSCN